MDQAKRCTLSVRYIQPDKRNEETKLGDTRVLDTWDSLSNEENLLNLYFPLETAFLVGNCCEF